MLIPPILIGVELTLVFRINGSRHRVADAELLWRKVDTTVRSPETGNAVSRTDPPLDDFFYPLAGSGGKADTVVRHIIELLSVRTRVLDDDDLN